MTPPQGTLSIERMCALAGVSRASYYRHWRRVAPRREQTELRDVLQRSRSLTATMDTGASIRCSGVRAGR